MIAFKPRRLRNGLMTLIAVEFVTIGQARAPLLEDRHFTTGWLLALASAVLVLFNARKKMPMIPLLTAATWLQVHLYVGAFAAILFFIHTGLIYPTGVFNLVLWWFFVLLTVSGLFGIAVERSLAPRLRERGEAILYDRIPIYRRQLADEVEGLAKRSVAETGSMLIANLYRDRIAPFMAGPRNFWRHFAGAAKPLQHLTFEMRTIERYLNAPGRDTLREMIERVVAKDNLDHQYALTSVLRRWLFLHVPLAYGLVLLVVLHVVFVYAFARI